MAEDLFPSPHPLIPPHHEEDWLSWIRLLRSRRVGVATFHRLIREHGSAQAALEALPEVARAAGAGKYTPCSEQAARAEMRAARKAGARPIAFGSDEYPALLAQIPDPPPLLWAIGSAAILSRPMIAIVGARNASSLGRRMARKLAHELSEAGYGIVSGLARGIDTEAHIGALDGGTVAVMAGGVDVIYPPENTPLAEKIPRAGMRLSEQPMGLRPIARHFPQRNRIVAGLSRAVIVTEAAARSGSLITARLALEQGREVLAVPGHPFDARASGCNMLIRDGAILVRGTDDVISALGPPPDTRAKPEQPRPGPEENAAHRPGAHGASRPAGTDARGHPKDLPGPRAGNAPATDALHEHMATTNAPDDPGRLREMILQRLSPSPLHEDQLIRDLDLPSAAVSPTLVTLELEGALVRHPGGMLSRL